MVDGWGGVVCDGGGGGGGGGGGIVCVSEENMTELCTRLAAVWPLFGPLCRLQTEISVHLPVCSKEPWGTCRDPRLM